LGQDAVDANHATDERVGLRTAKSCGPDAPTLASSVRKQVFAGDGGKQARSHKSAKETVKTIARGMPDVSGVTVVTNACAFYHCTRGCGRAERPAFPAPSELRAKGSWHNPGVSRRGNAKLHPVVIASVSEAIHFYRLVDAWIASLALAMTV
jgi:hypothetical protein